MIEYKIISLETFMELPEIKSRHNKSAFEVGDSDLSRSNGVVNFLQFMFDYMGESGWEYVGITKAHSQRVDLYVNGRGLGSFLKGVVHELGSKEGLNISNEGIIEAYIFVRKSNHAGAVERVNDTVAVKSNQSSVELPKVKEESEGPADSKCPSCSALIRRVDLECWKCKADFGPHSSWRPERF